ncbi:hypothetical protein Hanom_Chr11g00990181 [Helianthus anomalus]
MIPVSSNEVIRLIQSCSINKKVKNFIKNIIVGYHRTKRRVQKRTLFHTKLYFLLKIIEILIIIT